MALQDHLLDSAMQPTAQGVSELRKAIRHQLQHLGVHHEIHQAVAQLQASDTQPVRTDQVIELLKSKGVVDQVVHSIAPAGPVLEAAPQSAPSSEGGAPGSLDRQRTYLQVKVLGGRAFTDYLTRDTYPGEQLQLSLELFGQRFETSNVAAVVEPSFNGLFFVEVPGRSDGGVVDPLYLMSLRQPLHLVVVQSTPQAQQDAGSSPGSSLGPAGTYQAAMSSVSGHRVALAVGLGEWRTVLVRRKSVTISIQLGSGPGSAIGVPATSAPVGVIQLQLQLHPPLHNALQDSLLAVQQRTEGARDADTIADFIAKAKRWWAEYIQPDPERKHRPVKVLARGEDGAQYPAPAFVKPLQLGRSLTTARHAARFVSLLCARDDVAIALPVIGQGEVADCWSSLHTILATGCASKEEQAVLLCSLLLGFGLDAWVCVGRLKGGAGHMWVVTRGALATPCFWDPALGVRYSQLEGEALPYLSVGSLFNHQRLYANQQADDGAERVSFMLEEPSLWREMVVERSDVPGPSWSPLPLRNIVLPATADVEEVLEAGLKQLLEGHRLQVHGLSCTQWDDSLEHLLMPALVAYEHEAVTGEVAPGNEEFQQSIKRSVPLGWVFKGLPQHHRHLSIPAIAAALLDEPQVLDILATAAAEAAFALRVKLTTYPEGLVSLWLMLAVKYKGL